MLPKNLLITALYVALLTLLCTLVERHYHTLYATHTYNRATNPSNSIIPLRSYRDWHFDHDQPDQNTLYIFDIDDTIIMPVDAVLQTKHQATNPFVAQLKSRVLRAQGPRAYTTLLSQIVFRAIEPEIYTIFNKLKKQGIPHIALTSITIPSCSEIPDTARWRFEQLQKLNITFTSSLTHENDIVLYDTKTPFPSDYQAPRWYKGLLFTHKEPKGNTLELFLDHALTRSYFFTRIIAFENDPDALDSLRNSALKRGLQFKGYLYQGAYRYTQELDQEIAQYQTQKFIDTMLWLSDNQARHERSFQKIAG